MTPEEKKEIAKQLFMTRPGGEYVAPHKYKKYKETTNVVEKEINTSAGLTKIWLIDNLNRKKNGGVLINIHGGGFVIGHQDRDIEFCRRLSFEQNILVVDLDYKLAQEEEFPVACYQTYDCVKWVYDNAEELSIDTNKIIVAGHSAGANFAVGISLIAEERKEFNIALQILDYPPLDLYTDPEAKEGYNEKIMSADRARLFNELYLGDKEKGRNPLASPIFCTPKQCAGMPDTVIFTAQNDGLRYEAEKFAQMLIDNGVTVTIRRFMESRHGFVISCADEYNEAITRMGEYIRNVFQRDYIKYNESIKSDTQIEACAE